MHTLSLTLIALSYALGVISLWFCKILPNISHAFILGIICLLLFVLVNKKKPQIISLLFIVVAGFLFCLAQSQNVIKNRIPTAFERIPLTIVGSIINIPENEMQTSHFEFFLEQ